MTATPETRIADIINRGTEAVRNGADPAEVARQTEIELALNSLDQTAIHLASSIRSAESIIAYLGRQDVGPTSLELNLSWLREDIERLRGLVGDHAQPEENR